MDIRVIALYLAGKLPPYYKFRPNLYRFNKIILEKAGNLYNRDELLFTDKLVNSQGNQLDVYFYNILDDLYQEDEDIFYEVIKELEIPDEVLEQAGADINKVENNDKVNKETILNLKENKSDLIPNNNKMTNTTAINLKNLDTKQIALYLAGFLKEYDYKRFPRLYFMDKLEEFYGIDLDKLSFFWEQADKKELEFYNLVLDYLYSKAKKDDYEARKFYKFLKEKLDLPEELIKLEKIDREKVNFSRLAKYFTGKLPNSERISMKDFITILEAELGFEDRFLKDYAITQASVEEFYKRLLMQILESENGEEKIFKILKYFNLPESFIYPVSL